MGQYMRDKQHARRLGLEVLVHGSLCSHLEICRGQ